MQGRSGAQREERALALQLRAPHVVEHREARLRLKFVLTDPQDLVDNLGAAHGRPGLHRTNEIWKSTCFEAFFAKPGHLAYWEFNGNVHGHWNLYGFDDYRQPQPPQVSSDFDLKSIQWENLQFEAELEAASSLAKSLADLQFSLCAVIKLKDGTTHYFSNLHGGELVGEILGEKADFHRRSNRVLTAEHNT